MRSIKPILVSFILSVSGISKAENQPLPAGLLLQKLSLKLRGKSPSRQEINDFKSQIQQNPSGFQDVYKKTIARYLASEDFSEVIETYHSVWWKLPKSETTALARHIVSNDSPYRELFKKNYIYLDGTYAELYRQNNIQTEVPLPDGPSKWQEFRLGSKEIRFRSIFSNLDFLNKYPDTPTNLNRKRASYVFSTFLCEVLAPPPTQDLPPTLPDNGEHGTNPDCIGCHYRLDPMARFFDRWRPPTSFSNGTWYDLNQVAAGKLVIRDADGTHRIGEGTSETDLGVLLYDEPRLMQCIAKKAWEFAMGLGITLDSNTQQQLVQKFIQRESFKDLITESLQSPFFWSDAEVPPLKFEDIKTGLQVCSSCHHPGGMIDPKFDPATYPFDTDQGRNAQLLKRIWGAINRQGGFRPMPPPPRPKLPDDLLAKIREWILAGGFDNSGNSTLTESQITEILGD